MSTPDETHYDELTEAELDAALRAADNDLLHYVRKVADPSATLIAIMSEGDRHRDTTISVIEQRVLALDIARDIARTRDRAHDMEDQRWLHSGIGSDIARHLERVQELAWGVSLYFASDLDRDLALDATGGATRHLHRAAKLTSMLLSYLASPHDYEINSSLTRDLATDIARDLGLARTQNLEVHSLLATVPLNVSGLDLSNLDLSDLEAVTGVIWTADTTWPPDAVTQVEACSITIGPDTYQVVRGRTERDPRALTMA
jgi:hypothetical protein